MELPKCSLLISVLAIPLARQDWGNKNRKLTMMKFSGRGIITAYYEISNHRQKGTPCEKGKFQRGTRTDTIYNDG